jgi:NADH:ubiquinone oxidoreductase subunit 6 (subunit J)
MTAALLASFVLTGLGLGWFFAQRLRLGPLDRLAATPLLGLLAAWLCAWTVYVFSLPIGLLAALPVLGGAGLLVARRSFAALLQDRACRTVLCGQVLVSAWSLGWLAFVPSYSGGDWVGDWFGHWDRAVFFVERRPVDVLFSGFDPLPSRPPLANVVTGALLAPFGLTFAGYQVVSSLLNSLVFLPAAALAVRFGSPRAAALLAVLFMLNPLYVQNSTYAWTKLVAAACVLAGLYFFLRVRDPEPPPAAGPLSAAALGAGILAHYSAAVFALLLGLAWLRRTWRDRTDRTVRRRTGLAVATGAAVLLPWFAWAVATYGWRGTLLSNPSVTDQAPTPAAQLLRVALNLRDTLIPHPWREVAAAAPASPWAARRDYWFQIHQRNLFAAAGLAGGLLAAGLAFRAARRAGAGEVRFWSAFAVGSTVLGVAVHGGRDPWGNAHICLQSLVLLGLVVVAAAWPRLPAPGRAVAVLGLAADFLLGIALHFAVQSTWLDRWLDPRIDQAAAFARLGEFALMNLRAKAVMDVSFWADTVPLPDATVCAGLGLIFVLALWQVRGVAPSRDGR